MRRSWIAVGAIVVAVAAVARGAPPPAASAKPGASARPAASVDDRINPRTGLPMGHPAVEPPPPPELLRPGHDQALRERKQRVRELAAAEHEKFPRDEHGECIGQGPDDPPKNVNLVHGWLGVNNAKAAPLPPRPEPAASRGWFAERFGSWSWWKWRLTPYPFRYDNESDECDPRNTPVPLIANLINFGVLLFLIGYFGKKPIAEALRKRKLAVMAEIDRAAEIRRSAHERRKRYRHDLDHLGDKLVELKKQYAAEGDLEHKRLREELSQARDRMLADAAFRLDQEGKSAGDRLGQEALGGALGAAEKLIAGTIEASDHDRLCEEFLGQLRAALGDGKEPQQ